jgi:hypothetical protein
VPRRFSSPVALLIYGALALAYLLPAIASDPLHRHIGGLFTDPQIFIWSFAWWPHAIASGENPFYTHAIWAPDGVNLAWTTSVPGLALPFAPLTIAVGPIFAYNVACIVMPAAAAWTAFLLCRYLTRRVLPSLVGGYLFGFSSYVLSAELSHIHTAAVFLLPLVALLVLRFLRRDLSGKALVVALGGVLAWQATLSTEVLFMLTLALLVSLAAAVVLVPESRSRLRSLIPPLVGAYAFAALVVTPLIYFIVTSSEKTPNPAAPTFSGDLLNFVVPTQASVGGWWSSGVAGHFPGNDIERGAYLGVPTLIILGWFWLANRRRPAARLLLVLFVVAVLATLGSWLTIDGHRVASLPWRVVAGRTLFESVMPVRFSAYCALIAAVIVAMWAAAGRRPRWLRVILPAAAILAVAPNLSWGAWARTPAVPALFRGNAYRSCIPRDANVIVAPVGPRGDSMIWQALSGFWFRMAGGYITPAIPSSFTSPAIQHVTTADNPQEVTPGAIRTLARLKGATLVVVDVHVARTWRPILRPLGTPLERDGVLIYRLAGPKLTCARGRASAPAAAQHAPAADQDAFVRRARA